MPRYIVNKCCQEPDHLTNFKRTGYATEMGEQLADMESWIEDYAHGKRIKKFKTVCPSNLLEAEDSPLGRARLAAMWGKDPVHMTAVGYAAIADAIIKWMHEESDWCREPSKDDRAAATPPSNPGRRGRDWSKTRQDWILQSNTVATRHYASEDDRRGQWRSNRGSWGGPSRGWTGPRGGWGGNRRRGGGRRGGFRPY